MHVRLCSFAAVGGVRSCSSTVLTSILSLAAMSATNRVPVPPSSQCPGDKWKRNLFPLIETPLPAVGIVGANKGYAINEFLHTFLQNWTINQTQWQSGSAAYDCGMCRACEAPLFRLANQARSAWVLAVEFATANAQALKEQFERFRVPGVIMHAAGSDTLHTVEEPAGIPLGYEGVHVSAAGSGSTWGNFAWRETWQLPSVTVDFLAKTHMLQHVMLLSIDAEGHDPLILYGANKTLARRMVSVIQFEAHNVGEWQKHSLTHVLAYLRQHGFRCFWDLNSGKLMPIVHGAHTANVPHSNVACLSAKVHEVFVRAGLDRASGSTPYTIPVHRPASAGPRGAHMAKRPGLVRETGPGMRFWKPRQHTPQMQWSPKDAPERIARERITALSRLRSYVSSSKAVTNKAFCLGLPVALDFERANVLGWIAYHTLVGVDCFVLFVDSRVATFSHPHTLAIYQQLRSVPSLVQLVNVSPPVPSKHTSTYNFEAAVPLEVLSEQMPTALRLVLGAAAPRYFSYLDADEMLVLDRGGGSAQERNTPPNITAFLDGMHSEEHRMCGVSLCRWHYSWTTFTEKAGPGQTDRFARLVRRHGDEQRAMCSHLNGKLILRLASGAELDTMHSWRSDDGVGCVMLLPNGTTLQRGTAVQNIVTRQALSINHYIDTSFQGCVEKSQRSQVRTGGLRSSPEKCKAWGKHESKMVRDAALTAFVRATEERVQELFPTWDVRRQTQSIEDLVV